LFLFENDTEEDFLDRPRAVLPPPENDRFFGAAAVGGIFDVRLRWGKF